jgi:uncharacterized protein (TIGR02284 family)
MESTDTTTQVLVDLLRINKDRVEGYKNASYNTTVADLKGIFSTLADQSRKNVTDLTKEIIHIHSHSDIEKVANDGLIYKTWLDLKAQFAGSTLTIDNLLNCESAEKAVLNAYAVAKDNSFSEHLWELIDRQEESLKKSYEVIRSNRLTYAKS